jgi:FkbM family methyltransferase
VYTLKNDKGEKDFFYFLSLLNEKDDVLDIGANIGIMSTHLAKKAKDATVFSFEPVPDNIHALNRIIRFFKLSNVVLHEIALGDEEGEIEMVMPEVDSVKKQGLSHVVHEEITEFNEGAKFKVPLKILDNISVIQSNKIQAIKIDVENFEYHVFKGAESIIRKHKPYIYCELWDNENRYKCFDLMKSWNFETMVLHFDHLVPYEKSVHTTQNFFFVPSIA